MVTDDSLKPLAERRRDICIPQAGNRRTRRRGALACAVNHRPSTRITLRERTRALLVDDDDASCQATLRRLEDDGYTVLLARDGSDGFARAKRSVPNVIFTHLVTGGHDNVAFIQALRSDDVCRHVPVIVLSGRLESSAKYKQLRPVSRDRW